MVIESVDIMKQYRVYPHERFALRRLVSGTITSAVESRLGVWVSAVEECPYLTGSVMKQPVDTALLARNIQFITEVLAHYMFNLNDASLVRFVDCF